MASITNSWTDSRLSGTDTGDKIDDQLNRLSTDIHERLKNGGFYIPDSSDAKSGLQYLSPDAYYPNEWVVMDHSLTNKILQLVGTDLTLDGDFHAENIYQNGYKVLDESSVGMGFVIATHFPTSTTASGFQYILPSDCTLSFLTVKSNSSVTSDTTFSILKETETYDASDEITASSSSNVYSKTISSGHYGFKDESISVSFSKGDAIVFQVTSSYPWAIVAYFDKA